MKLSYLRMPSLLPSPPPPSLLPLLPLGTRTWLQLRSPSPSDLALSEPPAGPGQKALGFSTPRSHPRAGICVGTFSPAPSFSTGKLRGSEFLEVPVDCLHLHLRSAERGAVCGLSPCLPLPVWKLGGPPQRRKSPEEYCLGSWVWLSPQLAP